MAEEVSAETIQRTQKLLGRHVTKPQLTEKLLRKPPFRFLHDVVTSLIRDTAFLKGLYTDQELNSDNVKERDTKLAFLNKLINAVKTLSGKNIQVRASKIIAGLDVTETNKLLQTIAKLIDDKVDTREYVKEIKKSSKDSKDTNDLKDAGVKKGATTPKSTLKASSSIDKLDSNRKTKENKDNKVKEPIRKRSDASPKGAKEVKTKTLVKPTETVKKVAKGSKTSLETKESKIPRESKVSKESKLSKDAKTGKKISPKGTGSNASTPKSDGTPRSDKTDKSSPKTVVSPKLNQENEKKTQEKLDAEEKISKTPREIESDSWKPQVITEQETINTQEKPIEDIDVVDDFPNRINDDVKEKMQMQQEVEVNKNEMKMEEKPEMRPETIRQPSARPKSARPRSGNIAIDAAALTKVENKPEIKKPEAIKPMMPIKDFSLKNSINSNLKEIKDANEKLVENELEVQEVEKKLPFRPKSSMLRPPSVRPSSARPAAPRLRPESSLPLKEMVPLGKINVIVENFDAGTKDPDEDDEETVVIQNAPEDIQPEVNANTFLENNLDIPTDKGHLVEQILEQIQGPDGANDDVRQLEWETETSKGKDATTKEINALRSAIQALTRTANPLGKLTSYLHEDVEAMHSELETWMHMKKQFSAEIAKQKRINNESNQPLLNQLLSIEENIKKERDEIAAVKYSILKNDERIRHLVSKQIAIE